MWPSYVQNFHFPCWRGKDYQLRGTHTMTKISKFWPKINFHCAFASLWLKFRYVWDMDFFTYTLKSYIRYLILSVPFCSCLFLSVPVCSCMFLSVFVCSCLFLSVSVCSFGSCLFCLQFFNPEFSYLRLKVLYTSIFFMITKAEFCLNFLYDIWISFCKR